MRKMREKMAACLAAAILSMILMACGSTEDTAGAGQTAEVEEEALPESLENSDAAQRADIIDFLSAQENGVFSMDWNMELKKEW